MNFAFQSGMLGMLSGATLVVKAVLVLLALMSFVSWMIIFYKIFSLGRIKRSIVKDLETFQEERTLHSAMGALFRRPSSPTFIIAEHGRAEVEKINLAKLQPSLKFRVAKNNLERRLRQEVDTQMTLLGKSLPFLATCANSAPFIGLFGTVWGIMHSFHSIGMQKTAALAVVAPGISEALVATAIGLGVAIPASIAYNSFTGTLQTIRNSFDAFAIAFLNQAELEQSWLSTATGREER